MPRFLFQYIELFSTLGSGTPECPGGDFDFFCWIDAPDQKTALEWGHVLLGDYYQKRFQHSDEAESFDGRPIAAGEIESDSETIARYETRYDIPISAIGVVPIWEAPWKISSLRPKSSPDGPQPQTDP